jgi:xanthine dehydrogenase molybdenum-binding subunit
MATGVAINELPITPKTLFREFVAAGLITEGSREEQHHV